MSLLKLLQKFVIEDGAQYNQKPSRGNKRSHSRQIIVRQKGRQKRYKINKYGEIFER